MSKGRNLAKLLVSNTGSIGSSALATVLDTAPAQLDTLKELAAALSNDANFAVTVNTSLAGKQATLVSGTNIKSLNSTSLLGAGNITVQPTLVSGTNIKTVNGNSLLGSGNITISGGGVDYSTLTEIKIGANSGATGQNIYSVAIGTNAGRNYQMGSSVALGVEAGYEAQGGQSVAIGAYAGAYYQGDYAVALGAYAGNGTQVGNSIIINASGGVLNANTQGLFIKPVRSGTTSKVIYYDSMSGEMTYGDVPVSSGGAGGSSGPVNGNGWAISSVNPYNGIIEFNSPSDLTAFINAVNAIDQVLTPWSSSTSMYSMIILSCSDQNQYYSAPPSWSPGVMKPTLTANGPTSLSVQLSNGQMSVIPLSNAPQYSDNLNRIWPTVSFGNLNYSQLQFNPQYGSPTTAKVWPNYPMGTDSVQTTITAIQQILATNPGINQVIIRVGGYNEATGQSTSYTFFNCSSIAYSGMELSFTYTTATDNMYNMGSMIGFMIDIQ